MRVLWIIRPYYIHTSNAIGIFSGGSGGAQAVGGDSDGGGDGGGGW